MSKEKKYYEKLYSIISSLFESKYFEEIKKILSPIIYTADIFLFGERFN